ncbi:MAG TPA: hypothetical protein PLV92_18970 [Pirellulaceae bacterium]|nr:hypothetical protein [Pirellulaceae bacterium]
MVRLAREFDTGDDVRVRLTLGVPGVPPDQFLRWLGVRFVAWLDVDDVLSNDFAASRADRLPRRRMGVASSRIGRSLDERPDWLAALRAACAEAREQRWSLLAVTGTTTGPFMADAARRSGLPCLQVDVADDRQSFEKWLGQVFLAPTLPSSSSHSTLRPNGAPTRPATRLWISPPIGSVEQWGRALASLERAGLSWQRVDEFETVGGSDPLEESLASIPARDRALCVLADELRLLEVRRRGNWAKLVDARLAESLFSAESMRIVDVRRVDGDTSSSPESAAGTSAGFSASDVANLAIRAPSPIGGSSVAEPRIVDLASLEGVDLLIHCTRRQDGPWPGQAWSDYFDELWDDAPAKDRSASGALGNILRTGRIVASSSAIRGATPVICFTSAGVRELAALRRFRTHRHRWDFEPYGVVVSRAWLSSRGARPVVYGDESTWTSLPDSDRPYFQPTGGRAAIDWTVECEWRLIGDLSLDEIPSDAAYVLVATHADAKRLAPLSRWPFVVLTVPGEGSAASPA